MNEYDKYKNIDVPSFMKKERHTTIKQEDNKKYEKAFIKGGLTGVLITFIMLGIFTFITIVEMI